MSDNGSEPTTDAPAQEAATQVVPQMDLGELLAEAIRKAVTGQINAQAKDIAAGVVGEMLTKEVIAGMRETATIEAEIALSAGPAQGSDPEAATEAATEGGPEAEPEAEQAAPPARELMYATVKEFVEQYIAQLYRREVDSRTPGLAWCPKWWLHGEAVARFEALHVAFEHLRHGEETELAAWWLTYLDPMMDRLLDEQYGPFKYCSSDGGHKAKLAALPVAEVSQRQFRDSDGEPVVAIADIEVPPAPLAQRQVIHGVWEPPEDQQ